MALLSHGRNLHLSELIITPKDTKLLRRLKSVHHSASFDEVSVPQELIVSSTSDSIESMTPSSKQKLRVHLV